MAWASARSLPDEATIVCPACRGPARFLGARALPVADPARLAGARDLRLVPSEAGMVALYRPGLAPAIDTIPGLTAAERADLALSRPGGDLLGEGACLCACAHRAPHRLRWPDEAFFAVEHKGQTLWATDRAMALAVVTYLEAPEKVVLSASPYGDALKRIPTHFRTAQNRDAVLKKLRRLLEDRP